MASSTGAKRALRAQVRAAAAALSPGERERSDRALREAFLALPRLERAGTVLLFHGVGTEPDTRPLLTALLARGKRVLLPRCLPGRAMEARAVTERSELVMSAFGIPEPGEDCTAVERDRIDLILVPGLCFDKRRYRLGQGGGYYDRYLSGYVGETAALCRDMLLLDRVPTEPHDRPVGLVLTETRRF